MPGWPGEEAYPPQPIVSQTRAVWRRTPGTGQLPRRCDRRLRTLAARREARAVPKGPRRFPEGAGRSNGSATASPRPGRSRIVASGNARSRLLADRATGSGVRARWPPTVPRLRAAGRGFGSGAWCFWPSAARSRRTSTSWADGTLRLPRAVVALIAVRSSWPMRQPTMHARARPSRSCCHWLWSAWASCRHTDHELVAHAVMSPPLAAAPADGDPRWLIA
jgi:hypothetical protein